MKCKTKPEYRTRRHLRVRRKILGDAGRPRMAVYRSNRHLYVQFIDDQASVTLAAASTLSPELAGGKEAKTCTVDDAKKLGALAASKAKGRGIEHVVFDRGGFAYGGQIKALAEAAREAGLQF